MKDRNESPVPSPAHSTQSGRSPKPSPPLPPPAPTASPPSPEAPLPPSPLHHFTWEQYAKFDPPSEFFYELVDGLVIHKTIPDAAHNELKSAVGMLLARLYNPIVRVYVGTTLQVLPSSWQATSRSAESGASSSSSPPLSPSKQSPSVRVPDVCAYFRSQRRADETVSPTPSTTSSAVRDRTERYCNEYAKKRVLFPAGKPPYMVFEVTCESDRDTDLKDKWVDYAAAGVQLYVIMDLACPESEGKPSVIMGSLKKREGWEMSTTGNPQEAPTAPNGSGPHVLYYFKKFSGQDDVDVSFFSKLNVKADQMLSASYLFDLGARILDKLMGYEKRADDARRRTEEAKRRTEEKELPLTQREISHEEKEYDDETKKVKEEIKEKEDETRKFKDEARRMKKKRLKSKRQIMRMREKMKARGVSPPESMSSFDSLSESSFNSQGNQNSNSASPSLPSPARKRQRHNRSSK